MLAPLLTLSTGFLAPLRAPAARLTAPNMMRTAILVAEERSVSPTMDDGSPIEVIHAAADKVFGLLDADSSGGVDQDELRAFLLALDFDEALISKMATTIDLDKDGVISADELRK